MSHEIRMSTYKENVDRKRVENSWNSTAANEDWQEGASGLSRPIRWVESAGILDSYEDAERYIRTHDKGDYDSLAVRFYHLPKLDKSKTYEVLAERAQRLQAKYYEYSDKVHYEGVKSSFITCRSCKSTISTAYIGKGKSVLNRCPICKSDLRPESTLLQIETAKKNADKAHADLQAENKKLEKKQRSKAEVLWLLKVEYHT